MKHWFGQLIKALIPQERTPPLTAEERQTRRRIIEEQDAFRWVMCYSVEDAYGLNPEGRRSPEEEGG